MTAQADRDAVWYVDRFTGLIGQHDIDGAAGIAEQAQRAGIPDAGRMIGLIHWLRGDRAAARARWEAAVAGGDDSSLAYLAAAAHSSFANVAERSTVMARLLEAVRGPNGEAVIGRIVAASRSAADFEADPVWATELLMDALREGVSTALEAYLLVCGISREDLASDPDTDPAVLEALIDMRSGMVAWYACSNPSLPEQAARTVIADDAESLIRALAGNAGLSLEVRSAAQQRLEQLVTGIGDVETSASIVESSSSAPGARSQSSDDISKKLPSIDAPRLAPGSSATRDLWHAVVAGDFEAALRETRTSSGMGATGSADPLESWACALALAWQADQQPESERSAAARAREAFEKLLASASPEQNVLATLSASLIAWRHSMDDLGMLLERAMGILERDVDGVPVYATVIDPPQLSTGSAHPWIVQWQADLHSLLDWLVEVFPRRAGAIALERGDLIAAEESFRQALGSNSPCDIGFAVNSLAFSILIPSERYDEAEALLLANAGSPWRSEAINSRSNLGIIAFRRGELARAQRLFAEVKRAGDAHTVPEATYYLALCERSRDQISNALRLLTEVMRASDSRYADMARCTHAETMLQAQRVNADPSELNSAGCYLRESGRREDAREAFLLAAAGGEPNALASLTWPLVLADEMDEAIAKFEQFAVAVGIYVEGTPANSEIRAFLRKAQANARSNAALAYLATGQEDRARELWREAAEQGHLEARIYPAVLAWRQGDQATACDLLSQVHHAEISIFASDMCEVLREGTGWFRGWAVDALDLIVFPTNADPLLVNNVAFERFSGPADRTTLMDALRGPARVGVPPSVAGLVQGLRMSGDPGASVEAFETSAIAMEAYLVALPEVMPDWDEDGPVPMFRGKFEEHVIDTLTEVGISYLTVGRESEAARVWSDRRVRNHPEALLGRAALSLREGKVDDARQLVSRILPWQRHRLESQLGEWIGECSQESERRWYEECRDVLRRVPGIKRPAPMAAAGGR